MRNDPSSQTANALRLLLLKGATHRISEVFPEKLQLAQRARCLPIQTLLEVKILQTPPLLRSYDPPALNLSH
jgi:hypothetical protein